MKLVMISQDTKLKADVNQWTEEGSKTPGLQCLPSTGGRLANLMKQGLPGQKQNARVYKMKKMKKGGGQKKNREKYKRKQHVATNSCCKAKNAEYLLNFFNRRNVLLFSFFFSSFPISFFLLPLYSYLLDNFETETFMNHRHPKGFHSFPLRLNHYLLPQGATQVLDCHSLSS